MAVYTTLTKPEIESLLAHFNLPNLRNFHGSTSGIENTTYFVTLNNGSQYVLTVFESFSADALRPYIHLMSLLGNHKLPVSSPCIDKEGIALQTIANKPALLFPRSPGKHIEIPTSENCHAVGCMLARIHLVTLNISSNSPALLNPCDLSWMNETLGLIKSSLDQTDIKILQDQIRLYADLDSRQLPRAVIHGDLFRDNVLIENDNITAVIDFYNAGEDILLMDLAIAANDWCNAHTSATDNNKNIDALLNGYQLHRPFSATEFNSWQECLQVAAARLWLSRQKRLVLSQLGNKGAVKDPSEYRVLLLDYLKISLAPI